MQKLNKILLFRPKPDKKDRFILTAPLSLLTVAAPLLKNGYEIVIIDAIIDGSYMDKILKEAENALCIGITSMTGHQIKDGLDVSEMLKKNFHEKKIIWGGWHPTIVPRETVIDKNIDIVVEGPGEQTFLELCDSIKHEKNIGNVRGLYYKEGNNIVYTGRRYLRELKEVYDIPYELIDINKYIRKTAFGDRAIDYRSSYGCPYNCYFCADFLMSDRHWFSLPAEQVVKELTFLFKEKKIDSVLMLENEFFIDKNRVRKICEGLLANNVRITFGNLNVRPDQLFDYEPDLWEIMKKAGIRDLLVGVESGTQNILDRINKKTKVDDILKLKELASKYEIELFLSLMIGFPFEDISPDKELEDILNLVKKCRAIDEKQTIFIAIYMPYPGTNLFKECLKKGFNAPSTLEEWSKIDLTEIHTPWISREVERKVNMLNNYIFQYISDQFSGKWDKIYTGRLKKLKKAYHSILSAIALYRFNHSFFKLPLEYCFLEFTKDLKAKYNRYLLKLKSSKFIG